MRVIIVVIAVLFYNISSTCLGDDVQDKIKEALVNIFASKNIANGEYSFRFTTADNTIRQESGELDENGNLLVKGFYSFVDPAGETHQVSYIADKDGYKIIDGSPSNVGFAAVSSQVLASLLG